MIKYTKTFNSYIRESDDQSDDDMRFLAGIGAGVRRETTIWPIDLFDLYAKTIAKGQSLLISSSIDHNDQPIVAILNPTRDDMMGPDDSDYYEWAYYEDGERLDWSSYSGNEEDDEEEDEFEDDED